MYIHNSQNIIINKHQLPINTLLFERPIIQHAESPISGRAVRIAENSFDTDANEFRYM